jgi:hypothetical protein
MWNAAIGTAVPESPYFSPQEMRQMAMEQAEKGSMESFKFMPIAVSDPNNPNAPPQTYWGVATTKGGQPVMRMLGPLGQELTDADKQKLQGKNITPMPTGRASTAMPKPIGWSKDAQGVFAYMSPDPTGLYGEGPQPRVWKKYGMAPPVGIVSEMLGRVSYGEHVWVDNNTGLLHSDPVERYVPPLEQFSGAAAQPAQPGATAAAPGTIPMQSAQNPPANAGEARAQAQANLSKPSAGTPVTPAQPAAASVDERIPKSRILGFKGTQALTKDDEAWSEANRLLDMANAVEKDIGNPQQNVISQKALAGQLTKILEGRFNMSEQQFQITTNFANQFEQFINKLGQGNLPDDVARQIVGTVRNYGHAVAKQHDDDYAKVPEQYRPAPLLPQLEKQYPSMATAPDTSAAPSQPTAQPDLDPQQKRFIDSLPKPQ